MGFSSPKGVSETVIKQSKCIVEYDAGRSFTTQLVTFASQKLLDSRGLVVIANGEKLVQPLRKHQNEDKRNKIVLASY